MKTKILAIVLFLVTFFSISSYSQRYFITDTTEVILLDGTSTYTIDKFSNLKEEAKILVDKIYDIVDNSKMIDDIDIKSDEIVLFVNDRINSNDIKELNTLISLFTMNNYYRTKSLPFLVISEDNKVLISLVLTHSIEEINGNKATYKCNIGGIIDTNFLNIKHAKDFLSKYGTLLYKVASYK